MRNLSNVRYRSFKRFPGIRKDMTSGKYLAEVSVQKKRLSKSFLSLDEAVRWRNSFLRTDLDDLVDSMSKKFLFKDLWSRYKEEHLPTLQKSSQENRILMEKFFEGLWEYEVNEITPGVLSRHIVAKKEVALKIGSHRRMNFDHEVKLLKSVFNWHHDEIDHTFSNPVTKKHKVLGVIRIAEPRNKKLNLNELKAFLNALRERPFWYDFALTQLLIAGRVQEVAGLQKKCVDLKNNRLIVRDVAVWSKKTKRFDHLKPMPKNGEVREVYLINELASSLAHRISNDVSSSGFVFHENGSPLSYRQIQYNYDWALRKAGLSDKFSGTHILRHSMATLTRLVTGSLNSTQAVTGHKDLKLVQHYASIGSEENKRAILAVQDHLEQNAFFGIRADYEQVRAGE